MLIFLIIFGIISLVLLLWQVSNLLSVIFGSPYVMMDKKVIRQALKKAGLKKGEVFYDLGCGNGQVVIEAAKLGVKARGFEISPYYYIWAKLRTPKSRNTDIRYKNITDIDLYGADVVYCYLLPKMLGKLTPKFKGELKPGSRLISIGFPIIHARALKMEQYNFEGRKIFIYQY